MIYTDNNIKIYYETTGEEIPIIMLHGTGCDHQLMKGCMEPVFQNHKGYKRIYIDLPGMGNSAAPPELDNSDKILTVLITLINKLSPGNFLLAGESYGGYLARGVLAKLPRRVKGLLLLCPVVIPEHDDRNLPEPNIRFYDGNYLKQLSADEQKEFCEYAVIADQYTHSRFKEEISPGIKTANNGFIEKLQQNYRFTFDVDKEIHTLKFDKPVLLIAGRQDNCVGYRDLWSLIEDYPRATFSVLDMAGHNLQIEQPKLFHCLVDDWLKRIS